MPKYFLIFLALITTNCGDSAPKKDDAIVLNSSNSANSSNAANSCGVCDPPAPFCRDGFSISPTSVCAEGRCLVDESAQQDCASEGASCIDGRCEYETGACAGVTCTVPSVVCDGDVIKRPTGGSCNPASGECEFEFEETNCATQGLVCSGGSCVAGRKRVFVTANRYTGDLARQGNSRIGSEGAHNICQAEADAAGIGGRWYAFISDSDREVLEERDRLAFPYYLVDRETLVVESSPQLFVNGPLTQIDVTPDGTRLPAVDTAWTGTSGSGAVADVVWDCDQWTDGTSGAQGVFGLIDDDLPFRAAWTEYDNAPCNDTRRLYCFEL